MFQILKTSVHLENIDYRSSLINQYLSNFSPSIESYATTTCLLDASKS